MDRRVNILKFGIIFAVRMTDIVKSVNLFTSEDVIEWCRSTLSCGVVGTYICVGT